MRLGEYRDASCEYDSMNVEMNCSGYYCMNLEIHLETMSG